MRSALPTRFWLIASKLISSAYLKLISIISLCWLFVNTISRIFCFALIKCLYYYIIHVTLILFILLVFTDQKLIFFPIQVYDGIVEQKSDVFSLCRSLVPLLFGTENPLVVEGEQDQLVCYFCAAYLLLESVLSSIWFHLFCLLC